MSYAIINSSSGASEGAGSIEMPLAGPPADVNEIVRLADDITEHSHGRGSIPNSHHVAVLAWSRIGG